MSRALALQDSDIFEWVTGGIAGGCRRYSVSEYKASASGFAICRSLEKDPICRSREHPSSPVSSISWILVHPLVGRIALSFLSPITLVTVWIQFLVG